MLREISVDGVLQQNTPESRHSRQIAGMTAYVKGCRTSAVGGCQRHPRSAGVGQASREETAQRHVLDHTLAQ